MPRQKPLQAVLMATPDDTEAQFYEALQQGDLDRLMAVWSDDDDITCIHPGGMRLVGLQAVRHGFDEMFQQGQWPLRPVQVRRVVMGVCAIHHVLEEVRVETEDGARVGYIQATNVYTKTPQGWRMVLHHASQGSIEELTPFADAPSVLH